MAKSHKTSKRPLPDPRQYQPSGEMLESFERAEQSYASGDFLNAVEIYRKILALDKRFLIPLKRIALCELQMNAPGRAIKHLVKYLKSVTQDPEASAYLAQAYLISGQTSKAKQSIAVAIKSEQTADLYFLAATIEEHLNAPEKAVSHYENGLELAPNHASARLAIGVIQKNLGNFKQAIIHFETILVDAPKNQNALANLGNVYHAIGLYEQAIELYERAESIDQEANIAYNRGLSLQLLSKPIESIRAFELALELNPEHLDAQFQLAENLSELGRFDDANKMLDTIVTANPKYVMAWYAKSQYQKFTEKNTEVEQKLLALSKQNQDSSESSLAHFGLAKIYDDTQRHDAAFEHYLIANKQKAKLFKQAADRQLLELTKPALDSSGLSNIFDERAEHPTPIFIIGMPRSGTTILELKIASAKEITACGEIDFFGPALFRMKHLLGEFNLTEEPGKNALSAPQLLQQNYLNRVAPLVDASRYFVDKTPDNFRLIRPLELLFPTAKFIHCERNPLDTCLSIFFQNFENVPYSYDLTTIAEYYLCYREIADEHRQRLSEQNKWLDVVYEDYVANEAAVTNELSSFLDCRIDVLDKDESNSKSPIRTMSKWQARQAIHQGAVGRWESYADKLSDLRDALSSIL